jgi:UDPglucose--hexose-1-phosphate uridylyltransferase
MELRKDPITRSWVMLGEADGLPALTGPCPFCRGNESLTPPTILALPDKSLEWQVRVVPHFRPMYRIEGDPGRSADGIYDRMRAVGAHEIIVESPVHDWHISTAIPQEINLVLKAFALRVLDLKQDRRFKYVTVFRNRGERAGQEWPHPHSQLTATTFVPRRILYELRASREYFAEKERCVFCDIVRQDERENSRVVEILGSYVALCPYASRVPYEIWILPRYHHHAFESDMNESPARIDLAMLIRRTVRRLEAITDFYHMVLHTSPNSLIRPGVGEYWKTLADDYHWHIEILPIIPQSAKSYVLKEVYYSPVIPETAAEQLRQVNPEE